MVEIPVIPNDDSTAWSSECWRPRKTNAGDRGGSSPVIETGKNTHRVIFALFHCSSHHRSLPLKWPSDGRHSYIAVTGKGPGNKVRLLIPRGNPASDEIMSIPNMHPKLPRIAFWDARCDHMALPVWIIGMLPVGML
jgi:hypothetical protein